jgi:tetratricopeptide (TPR) repeat protein
MAGYFFAQEIWPQHFLVIRLLLTTLNNHYMKRNQIYLLCIVLFMAVSAFTVYRYQHKQTVLEETVYTIIPRKEGDTSNKEWKEIKTKAEGYQLAIQNNPTDYKSLNGLTSLFIQEARNTGNYAYYDIAAMKTANDVLKMDSTNFEALVFKSLIYLSQHHFADGLAAAQKAKQVNPYNAYVYGLMVDGYVEMGHYDSAIQCADQMVTIRPDLSSYSRLSYLREIHGDYTGAIQAMKMAVEAGGPGDENTEWARVQMAQLLEKTGDYKNAEQLYLISLQVRKNYPFALCGLGRVAMAAMDYKKAISYFEKADLFVIDNGIKTELATAYRMAGDGAKALELYEENIEALSADAKAGMDNENMGHYADRELAYAYVETGDYDKALEHSLLEYNRRPGNIDVNETLAWLYYKKGDIKNAYQYMQSALKTNSKNPVLLSRAALIYYKAGDTAKANSMFNASSLFTAKLDMALSNEAKQVFQQQTSKSL